MNLADVASVLDAKLLTPRRVAEGVEVTSGFASDLLSDVMANAAPGGLLVTVQAHVNVVAVAVHCELAAVVFAQGRKPEKAVIDRATEEGIALLTSDLSAFDIVGQLYGRGLRGPGFGDATSGPSLDQVEPGA